MDCTWGLWQSRQDSGSAEIRMKLAGVASLDTGTPDFMSKTLAPPFFPGHTLVRMRNSRIDAERPVYFVTDRRCPARRDFTSHPIHVLVETIPPEIKTGEQIRGRRSRCYSTSKRRAVLRGNIGFQELSEKS